MNKQEPIAVGDVAERVTGRALTLSEQTAQWIAGNLGGILIATAIGTLIALALLTVRSLGCRLLRSRGTGDIHWRTIFARVLAKTNLPFIILCAAVLVAEYANTPPAFRRIVEFAFVISAAFQAAIWARELIIGFVEHRVGGDAEHSTLGSAVGIIRLLVSVALFAIAIILILDNLGVNVTGLVAGLGIGGIAIGLAAQGIFSDLFAALSIIFDKPFRRGDAVRFEDVNGHVEQIGLKTTRIRSLTGEQIIVSNAKLLEKQLHNFTNLQQRRIVLALGIVYQIPQDVLAGIPEMLRDIVNAHKNTQMVRCGLVNFGASSLDFELVFDVRSTDYDFVFKTRSDICLEILKAFNDAGIGFAYPTQVGFTAGPDGRLVMPYPDVTMIATEDLDPDHRNPVAQG
jgi:small-conductance mechanosensitive channel